MCVRIPDPHHIVHGAGGEETGGGEKGRRISVCGLGSHRNEGVEIGVGGGRGVGSGEECHGKDAVLVAGEEGMGMGEVDAAEGAKEDASVGRSREGRAVGGNGEGVRGLPVPLCDSWSLVALWGFEPAWAAACEDYICTIQWDLRALRALFSHRGN